MKKPIWLIIRKRLSSFEFYTRFWNDISQLTLWICLTRAIDMNLDLPFLYNALNKNEETYLINYSETVEFIWVLHKVLKWYLPTHSVDLSSQGP